MADFEITREVVRELDTIGAIQLPVELAPPKQLVNDIVNRKYSTNRSGRSLLPPESYQDLEFWEIIEEIYLMGTGSSPLSVSAESLRRTAPNMRVHRDRFLQKLSLVHLPDPKSDDQLRVYGRGHTHPSDPDMTASFMYENGPVILAAHRFGEALGSSANPRGHAWHQGVGRPGVHIIGVEIH